MNNAILFVVGFLTGLVALYVWNNFIVPEQTYPAYTNDTADIVEETNADNAVDEKVAENGDMKNLSNEHITVVSQPAGGEVVVARVNIPVDGWIVVHEVIDGVVGKALGAARRDTGTYNDVVVELQRVTEAGGAYQVALYNDNGNREFEIAVDAPLTDEQGAFLMGAFQAL